MKEPRNPFYLLLLLASLLFVVTALAYAFVPTMEDRAIAAGRTPPFSAVRAGLREDGWKWLLTEVAFMFAFGFLSMGLDRLRSLKNPPAKGTITTNTPTSADSSEN